MGGGSPSCAYGPSCETLVRRSGATAEAGLVSKGDGVASEDCTEVASMAGEAGEGNA